MVCQEYISPSAPLCMLLYRQLVLNVYSAEVYVNLYASSLHLAFIILPADITLNVYFAQFRISETTF